MVTVRVKTLFKKDISGRTVWSKYSLERDVAAFRPKEDVRLVCRFPADDVSKPKIHFYHTVTAMRLSYEIHLTNPSLYNAAGVLRLRRKSVKKTDGMER